MSEPLTTTQQQRLKGLSAPPAVLAATFEDAAGRDAYFREQERLYVNMNREKLLKTMNDTHRPLLLEVQDTMCRWLMDGEGFTQVATPAFITKEMLGGMTITDEHPLTKQVFWLDEKRCLRPMLAPNLYIMMRDLHKITRQPVYIFEVGSCFRKESQGAKHLNEFTMLNLVELASVEEGQQLERLKTLAKGAMAALEIEDYELVVEKSEVYGETLDVVVDGEELASGAYGPHPLDANWGVFDTWVGIGFGLERVAMVKGGYQNIKAVGRGLSYFDGAKLNI
ncbi:pyrrolysine--tRNA(Pyl) ligase large subunit [Ruminococcaceae bacterium OttesenSCG-928-A11]|nr:pyrrolysine--tRNA(Pyl) ligase large subunit [Ruminococcaceae bacterium OttesenSCG-928-A11]